MRNKYIYTIRAATEAHDYDLGTYEDHRQAEKTCETLNWLKKQGEPYLAAVRFLYVDRQLLTERRTPAYKRFFGHHRFHTSVYWKRYLSGVPATEIDTEDDLPF